MLETSALPALCEVDAPVGVVDRPRAVVGREDDVRRGFTLVLPSRVVLLFRVISRVIPGLCNTRCYYQHC